MCVCAANGPIMAEITQIIDPTIDSIIDWHTQWHTLCLNSSWKRSIKSAQSKNSCCLTTQITLTCHLLYNTSYKHYSTKWIGRSNYSRCCSLSAYRHLRLYNYQLLLGSLSLISWPMYKWHVMSDWIRDQSPSPLCHKRARYTSICHWVVVLLPLVSCN